MGLISVTVKAVMEGQTVVSNLSSTESRKYPGHLVKAVVPSLCGTEKVKDSNGNAIYFTGVQSNLIIEDDFKLKEIYCTETVANVKEIYPTS
jgi:hypothetical protein